jgi:hypothetical protein
MDKHTAKNSKGCPQCWNENRPHPSFLVKRDIIPFEVFKKKANEIFQDKYSYVEESYNGLSKKMTIRCDIHGNFDTLPTNFLKSSVGCPKCARISASEKMTDSYDDFVSQANLIHNNKYLYPKENRSSYENKKSIVKIICPIHGEFIKKAQKHISGQGCFRCKIKELIDSNILVGGYNEDLFNKNPFIKNNPAFLYLLKINDYYKVGITTRNIKNRIKGLKAKAKQNGEFLDIDILKFKEDTLYNCYIVEQLILRENSSERLYKSWSTELLKNIDIEKYF